MSVSKATLQSYVDWCTSSQPGSIIQRRVGAFLASWPKADPDAGVDLFIGSLSYEPAGAVAQVPARFHGMLFSWIHLTIPPQYWTLDIRLFDLVKVRLLFPDGTISETAQVDKVVVPGEPPDETDMLFSDDYADYSLGLIDETVIDWNRIRRRSLGLLQGARVGRKTASRPVGKGRQTRTRNRSI